MPIPDKLLAILACPQCRVNLKSTGGGSHLNCAACQLSFRVVDDIPVLLMDEAEKID